MSKIENTVFISYRRTNIGFALAVYQNLTQHGYDVFLDYTGIDSGNFEQIIIENIKSRAHFIVILTLSALERVHEPNDWLRREIETAIDLKRNIIPLTFENFDWKLAREKYLTGKLGTLASYNELSVPVPYFVEAMDRLRNRYLNVLLDLVLHPVSVQVEQEIEVQQQEAEVQPVVTESALTVEELLEKGYKYSENNEDDKAVKVLTELIRVKPDYIPAYYNRGIAKSRLGDSAGAMSDYTEVIKLKPDHTNAYNNRGILKRQTGDTLGAIADYDNALALKPNYVFAYNNRGLAKTDMGDHTGAIADYDTAIRLSPEFVNAYFNRGLAKNRIGDVLGAIADYSIAIEQKSDFVNAYINRGELYFSLGQYTEARADFQNAMQLDPSESFVIGGLAVTLHKLGDTAKAINLWKMLCGLDAQYRDADWAAKKLNWPDAMREEARLLVAKL